MIKQESCSMNKPMKILVVEDDADDCIILQDLFAEIEGSQFDLGLETSLVAGLNHLEKEKVDIIILDMYLSDSVGLSTFDSIHAKAPTVPIIVLSGLDNEMIAESAVDKGASAYLIKQTLDSERLKLALSSAAIQQSQNSLSSKTGNA